MLTRKDYVKIAAILLKQRIFESGFKSYSSTLPDITIKLADYMAADNPNFDRQRFLDACYGGK